jgi:hypothetical protein
MAARVPCGMRFADLGGDQWQVSAKAPSSFSKAAELTADWRSLPSHSARGVYHPFA